MRRAAVKGIAIAILIVSMGAHAAPRRELRVCADPNNFPLSSEKQPGLEDELARLIAKDLGADVAYTWSAQRRVGLAILAAWLGRAEKADRLEQGGGT